MKVQASFPSLTVAQVPIDQLRPDAANPRRISGERLGSPDRPVGRPHGQCRSQTSSPSLCVRTDEFRRFSRSDYPVPGGATSRRQAA